eukprot:4726452-Pyramimonas_sp.AAC.1
MRTGASSKIICHGRAPYSSSSSKCIRRTSQNTAGHSGTGASRFASEEARNAIVTLDATEPGDGEGGASRCSWRPRWQDAHHQLRPGANAREDNDRTTAAARRGLEPGRCGGPCGIAVQ